MDLNKIISLDYFKANLEKIENLKDKNLEKAILLLVKFQVGNYLLSDVNTLRIDSISPHTVFAFNNALIKDISNSYEELEQSLIKVYESEYRDLIEDNPMINGKEIQILKDSEENITVVDKELYENLSEEFSGLINDKGEFLFSPYVTTEIHLDNKKLKIDLTEGYGKGGHELGYRNKIFNDNSKLEYCIKDKETKEIKEKFLCSNLYKIKSNKILYGDGEKISKLDMSPRLNFIDTAYKELTGLDKYKFNIVNNKLQKFIYGYLTNETNYVRSEVKGKIKKTYNEEYSSTQMKGRELLEKFNEEFEIFINKTEYSFKINNSKEDIYNEIFKLDLDTSVKQKSIFQKLLLLISNNIDSKKDIEDVAMETISKIKEFYENINNYFHKKEEHQTILNKLFIQQFVFENAIKNNTFAEKIKDMVSLSIVNGFDVNKMEELLKQYDINNIHAVEDFKRVSDFSKYLVEILSEKLDTKLKENYPYHVILDENSLDRENDFYKINKYLEGYSYIDYSISAYTKIRKNENIIEDEYDIDDINKILKNFISRTRAGIYDIKVDSFILNLRNDSELPMLSESLQKLYDNDNMIKEIIDNLKENKYYDVFEFDKDFINGTNPKEDVLLNKQKLLEFSKGINYLNLPVGVKNTFKVRKLGNYGGKYKTITGLYSDFAGQITVDTRNNVFFQSVKHEEIHRMDLNNINKVGRNGLISVLDNYFDKKIPASEMKNYYLIPEELIARAGEVTCMLLAGNFKSHYDSFKLGNISEKELWDVVKKDFESSKDYVLMKEFDRYLKNDEYIDFQNITNENSIESQIIDVCFEYYKPFFSNEKTDVAKLLKQSPKVGYENRQIEGLDTKKLDTNWRIIFDKKDKIEMLNLITKNFSITTVEVPNLKNIEKNEIRPLEEVLIDFANNNGNVDELQIHINGKGFQVNPLEKLNDDLLLSTVSNKLIVSMVVKDNQINISNLLNRIEQIRKNELKNKIYFQLLESVLETNIDTKEIKKFEAKYKNLVNEISYSSLFERNEEDSFYKVIGKSYGHQEDSSLKNLGNGLYNRYCLGDDYSQSAKDFDSFKFACETLKSIHDIKKDNNEAYYLKKIVEFSKEFIYFDSVYIQSILSSLTKTKKINGDDKAELFGSLKNQLSGIASVFKKALVNFIFNENIDELSKECFDKLDLNEKSMIEYAEKYRDAFRYENKPYPKELIENPFIYYEKFSKLLKDRNIEFSKINFINELIYELSGISRDTTKDILKIKVPQKINLERKDLEDISKILEQDKSAMFNVLLFKNLFNYVDINYSELLKKICASNQRRSEIYLRIALEVNLQQEDFNTFNEVLKVDLKEIEDLKFYYRAFDNNFNIDNTVKKQDYTFSDEIFEINDSDMVFINENIKEYEGNGYRRKDMEILKAYYALKNEDFSTAKQRFNRFDKKCGGLFVAMKDNYGVDYFSKYNNEYKDVLDEDEIKDFERITFSETDFISKVAKYIEYYFVDSKLDKYEKQEKKEFLRQICIFSNKIDESNILESLNTKRVGKNILKKIFDEDFLDYWNPDFIKIATINTENKNTNLYALNNHNLEKIKEKANKMLNNLDFLNIENRKKLALNFNNFLKKSIVPQEEMEIKYKELNKRIDCFAKEDIGEYIECKKSLYELYVCDFIIKNRESKMIDTFVSLDNKMKFHSYRRNSLLKSTDIEENKKADIHKEILLNGIKFIDKIIENAPTNVELIYPCKIFLEIVKSINNRIEASGVEETISNESRISSLMQK